jgi:hypothetical protein
VPPREQSGLGQWASCWSGREARAGEWISDTSDNCSLREEGQYNVARCQGAVRAVTITVWLQRTFMTLAVFFAVVLLLNMDSVSERPMDALSIFLVLGLLSIWFWALTLERKVRTSIVVIAALAMLLGYFQRVAVLVIDPSRYQFSWRYPLTSNDMHQALAFILASSIAFLLGWRLALGHIRRHLGTPPSSVPGQVFIYRRILFAVAVGLMLLRFLLQTITGIGLPNAATDNFGWMTRLLPVDGLAYLLMILLVSRWGRLALSERIAGGVFFGIYFLLELQAGLRSSLIHAPLLWLVTIIWVRKDPRFSARSVALVAGAVLLAFSVFLGFVTPYRDALYQSEDAEARPGLLSGGTDWVSIPESLETISDRLALLDATVVVGSAPPLIPYEFSPSVVAESFAGGFVPGFLWRTESPSLGASFGTLYEGLPPTARHNGAWSGFGLMRAFFGLSGILGFLFLGWFSTVVLHRVSGWPLLVWAGPMLLDALVWFTFLSGNVDTIYATYLSQWLLVQVIVVFIALRKPPRLASPPAYPQVALPNHAASGDSPIDV